MTLAELAMKRKRAPKKIFSNYQRFPEQYLYGLDSLVEFSFVSHKSLTPLDLSRSEYSRSRKKEKQKTRSRSSHKTVTRDNFIYTEESCRKRLAPDRRVLYEFHLDVCRELELSLRYPEIEKISKCYSDSILLNRMVIFEKSWCELHLSRIILEAIETSNQKVRLISHISKIAKRLQCISKDKRIRDRSLTLLCFQRAESNVVKEFLTVMDIDYENLFTHSVHIFEFVVHHANRTGYNLWRGRDNQDAIYTSISYHMFVKAEVLFQYRSAPSFCETTYNSFQQGERWSLPANTLKLPGGNTGLITKERHLLILVIFHICWKVADNGLKALQMIWRSIPDPFINLDEIKLTLSRWPNPKMIEQMSRYIKLITGEDVRDESGHQPRKLKHYCRILIRGILENNRQLAAGVTELHLPHSMESYLRLEK